MANRDKGILIKPNKEKSFECYVDADFCGNWDPTRALEDPDTARSHHGFIIKYAGVPIYWMSKLQTQFSVSTAESEYIGLSKAALYIKGTMYLLEEIKAKYDDGVYTIPRIHCKVFEDNSAALEMARVPKMRLRTRHLNIALHHFRGEVASK